MLLLIARLWNLQTELLRIVAACGHNVPAEDRYIGLRVLDEAPW